MTSRLGTGKSIAFFYSVGARERTLADIKMDRLLPVPTHLSFHETVPLRQELCVFRVVLKDTGKWTVKICADEALTNCVQGSVNLTVKGKEGLLMMRLVEHDFAHCPIEVFCTLKTPLQCLMTI